jgi:hypothetical protein
MIKMPKGFFVHNIGPAGRDSGSHHIGSNPSFWPRHDLQQARSAPAAGPDRGGPAGMVRLVDPPLERLAEAVRLGFRLAAAPSGETASLAGLDIVASGALGVGRFLRDRLGLRPSRRAEPREAGD